MPTAEETVSQILPRIRELADRFATRTQDADDICQEASVRVLTALRRGNWPDNLHHWLFRVVQNAAHQYYRRRQESGRAVGECADEAEPVGHALEAVESAERLRSAMDRLDERHRQLLQWRYFDQLSERQIAEHLGIPVGTVKSATSAARDRLRTCLAE